jgi:hypothetical protein
MKTLTLFSTIALSAALSLSACKKDKKEDKPADTPATDMAKTTEGTAAADTPAEPTPPCLDHRRARQDG